MHETVPFNVPTIEDEEIAQVVAALRSGWLIDRPPHAEFRQI